MLSRNSNTKVQGDRSLQMLQWVAPGAQSSQAFATKLGLDGDEEFAALLVCDVETSDDDGVQVPKKIKKLWQHWLLKGHPDKGGRGDAYVAMHQEYEAFKKWFPARSDLEGVERGQQKKCAFKVEEAAQIARADSRHEEASKYASQAIAVYRTLQEYWTHEMDQASMKSAATDLQRAQELLDAIFQEAEEVENERCEREEHGELTSGLNLFFNSVYSFVSDELTIPQKFGKLRAFFDEREKHNKAEIVGLEDDTRKKSEEMQKMLVDIEDLNIQLRDAKHDCQKLQASLEQRTNEVHQLQVQNTEMQQDNISWTKALEKVANYAKGSLGIPVSSSARPAKPTDLTAYFFQLEKGKKEIAERFEKMQSDQKVSENEAAEATKTFNRTICEAHLRYDEMDKKYVEQLRTASQENEEISERLKESQSDHEVCKNEAAEAGKISVRRIGEIQLRCDKECDELLRTANLKVDKSTEDTKHTEQLKLEAIQSDKQIEQLSNQIEQLRKQCNSTCKQEVVELKSQLAKQAAQHIIDVNPKALEASEKRKESGRTKSSVPDYDPAAYAETSPTVFMFYHLVYTGNICGPVISAKLRRFNSLVGILLNARVQIYSLRSWRPSRLLILTSPRSVSRTPFAIQ